MWIKRVEIAGWKSFSHDEPVLLEDCGMVNLLIGPNNVGKSNLQRFFYHLAHGTRDALRNNVFTWEVPGPIELFLKEKHIHWGSKDQSVRASIDYYNNSQLAPPELSGLTDGERFAVKISARVGERQDWDEANPLYVRSRDPLYVRRPGEADYGIQDESGSSIHMALVSNRTSPSRLFLNQIFLSAFIDSVRIVGSQRNNDLPAADHSRVKLSPGSISTQLYQLKNDLDRAAQWARVRADLQSWLARVLGYPFTELDFVTLSAGQLITTLGRPPSQGDAFPATPLQDLGTGVTEYFTLLAFLRLRASDGPLAVFIDEIEAHLHPSATRELVRIIRKEFPKVQLFLATHSTDLLDQVDDDWRIFRFSMPGAHTIVTPISAATSEAIDTIRDLGYRPAQLFMANCIIFVEGPSDIIYLNALLEHVASDLVEGRDYSFLFYGGANIAHISYEADREKLISLLRCANNPIVVCDRDRKEGELLKPAVEAIKLEAERPGRSVFITPGYEIESIMTPAALSSIANELMSRMQTKHRGTADPAKLDTTLSLRDALGRAITPAKRSKTTALHIAERLANDRKVDIARAFAKLARTDAAGSFSKAGHDWGLTIRAEIARAGGL